MDIDEKHFLDNVKTIQSFENYLKLQGKARNTLKNKIITVKTFLDCIGHKNVEAITRADIDQYVLHLKEQGMKPDSQNVYIVNLKLFIKFLNENNEKFNKRSKGQDYFQNVKLNKQVRDTSEKEYFTRDDINAMLSHCKSQRDRALLLLLWDSGGRISEVLNMNISDIKFGKKYVTAVLTGKTGTREVVISSSVPDIQLYLNQRKESKPTDPLFTTIRKSRLTARTVLSIYIGLVEKAGIAKEGKKTNIHSTRHGRMTELADKGVPEMHLRRYAGWTSDSDMPSKYIHPTQKQVDKKILLSDGYTEEEISEEVKPVLNTKPIKCPNPVCQFENPFDSVRCVRCATILNEKLAMDTREQEIEEEKKKIADMKKELKEELMADMINTNTTNLTELMEFAEQLKGIKEFSDIFTKSSKQGVRDKLPDTLKPLPQIESEELQNIHKQMAQEHREQRRKEKKKND